MDVETAITLASTAAGSAATEAGRAAWESLVSLARRVTGRPAPESEPEAEDPTVLVGRIADHARDDADFAAQLCQWAADHQASLHLTIDQGKVQNTISPGAQISGKVIQAGDIHGNITL
jgi:hypothetical protein